MMAINSTQDLSSSVGRFYLPLNRTAQEDPVFSLPYIDEADGGENHVFINFFVVVVCSFFNVIIQYDSITTASLAGCWYSSTDCLHSTSYAVIIYNIPDIINLVLN